MPDSAHGTASGSTPGSAREEAERLVAAVIAMATGATAAGDPSGVRDSVGAGLSGLAKTVTAAVDRLASVGQGDGPNASQGGAGQRSRGGHTGWATGSAECCVCPICQAIAAVRDPSPETAVRLAMGAGDIASGVASLMRGLSSVVGGGSKRPSEPAAPKPPPDPDQTWSAATRTGTPRTGTPRTGATRTGAADAANPTNPENPASGGSKASAADLAAAGLDPWAAASAASAASAEEEQAAAREARRKAAEEARAAAAEAAKRVAEAAALAKAAKAAADSRDTGSGGAETAAAGRDSAARERAGESGNTAAGGAGSGRTPRRFDVWAAATAEAGVGDVTRPTTVDHDDLGDDSPGAAAPAERGGDAAPGDDAV